VVNPFAEQLTFLDDRTRTRRDHTKYLALIRTLALLHQYQRPVKTAVHAGQDIDYIEVTRGDIAAANALAHQVLGRCLDEMPPQTRRLLELIERMVAEKCRASKMERADVLFRARQLREFTGWGNSQLHVHLSRLVDLEYVLTHRADHGQGNVYELVYDGQGKDGRRFLSGLLDVRGLAPQPADAPASGGAASMPPRQCDYEGERPGVNGDHPVPVRPVSGPHPGPIRPTEPPMFSSEKRDSSGPSAENAHLDALAVAAS